MPLNGRFMGYPNYIDSQLSRKEAHSWYYPTHTEKLQRIMRKVNPGAIFDYPQGFLPASCPDLGVGIYGCDSVF